HTTTLLSLHDALPIYWHLPFTQAVAHLKMELGVPSAGASDLLGQTAAFYRLQFQQHDQAHQYLYQRGLRDPGLIPRLGIGFAPGDRKSTRLNSSHSQI